MPQNMEIIVLIYIIAYWTVTGTGDFDISSTDMGFRKEKVVVIIERAPPIIKNHDITVIEIGRFSIFPPFQDLLSKTL
jgi:hypothetical protein